MSVVVQPQSDAERGDSDAPQAGMELASGPRTPYERDAPIHAVFERQVRATPTAIALADAAGTLTYAELDRAANRLAAHLRGLGVSAGAAVGVGFERSRNLPITLLAILKAGAAYVPLDPSYPAERIAFILADANVAFVIVEHATQALDLPAARVVCLADDAAAIAAQSGAPLSAALPSTTPAYVMYTSGSTGRAKGVVVTHRGVVRLVRGAEYFASGAGHTFLQFAPAAFDASTFELWGALLNGACLAIPRPGLLSIDELGAAVERFGVTTMWLTASIFQRVVEAGLPSFAGLRQLLTGGSAGSPQHMVRFLARYPECRLINGYGPTENTTFSTTCHLSSPELIGSNPPIGRPIAHSTAYVLDQELQPVALGVPGELWVGGDGVALGYLNLPAETRARFVPDPFSPEAGATLYRTGDRVRMRADGMIEFLGRTDDQVKIHGYRIELGEIEAVLRAHPSVRDAAVVAIEREPGDKTLAAQIVAADGSHLDDTVLRAYLRAKLPAYMVPPRTAVVRELPLHPSGKIDRVTLAERALAAVPLAAPRAAAAQTPSAGTVAAQPLSRPLLTRAVTEIWREALSEDRAPEPDVNFFDAGGDSIRLLRLQSLLTERLGAKLSVLDLFEHTTIARIVGVLLERRA